MSKFWFGLALITTLIMFGDAKASFVLQTIIMEIGKWNKLPHYSVTGSKVCMYLWSCEIDDGVASVRITGRAAFKLWNELQSKFLKDKKSFVRLLKSSMVEHSN